MRKKLPLLTGTLLILGSYFSAPAHAQYVPIVPVMGLARMIAAQNAATKAIAERTTTTTAYHGESFLMKRTPNDLLVGDAADRIAQLETQLALSYTALLADSTSRTCPAERQATIQAAIKYIGLNRPGWDQKAYRQELKFYLAEDKRRRQAAK